MPTECSQHTQDMRNFLNGARQNRPFVTLDPSSYAAVFAGKPAGSPTIEDNIAFHQAFPNDAFVHASLRYEELIGELCWTRNRLRQDDDGTVFWEETLNVAGAVKRRVVADKPGGIPWLVEPAAPSTDDLDLVDFYAERILEHVPDIAAHYAEYPPAITEKGMIPGATILTAFELYWLVDYPDMPMLFLDNPERYLTSIRKVHAANLALLDAMHAQGFEIAFTGSAGLELLSPAVFQQAIVPFQREFNDHARSIGCHTSYHICGHSRQLIELGIIDQIKPTIFETCSTAPCGNNKSLVDAVWGVDEDIITKGNLDLDLLYKGTVDQIRCRVHEILEATEGRRHIVGQGDATIITGTPHENIRAFVAAVTDSQ